MTDQKHKIKNRQKIKTKKTPTHTHTHSDHIGLLYGLQSKSKTYYTSTIIVLPLLSLLKITWLGLVFRRFFYLVHVERRIKPWCLSSVFIQWKNMQAKKTVFFWFVWKSCLLEYKVRIKGVANEYVRKEKKTNALCTECVFDMTTNKATLFR